MNKNKYRRSHCFFVSRTGILTLYLQQQFEEGIKAIFVQWLIENNLLAGNKQIEMAWINLMTENMFFESINIKE